MIKVSYNVIGQEVQLVTHPAKSGSLRLLSSFGDHLKTLRDPSILFTDIGDQRILQHNWTRGTTGHTQPEVVVSDATFLS